MNKLLSLCPQGQKLKTSLAVHETATIPPLCLRGASAGPTLVVTTGMHDCEFVRAEDDRLLFDELDPAALHGSLIVLPLVNPLGFCVEAKQVMPQDGKNLNRFSRLAGRHAEPAAGLRRRATDLSRRRFPDRSARR